MRMEDIVLGQGQHYSRIEGASSDLVSGIDLPDRWYPYPIPDPGDGPGGFGRI